jgi:hypothetical protein
MAQLRQGINTCREPEQVRFQKEYLTACIQRLLKHPPHEEQVLILQRLIFGIGDVFLIAKTGWERAQSSICSPF